MARKRAANAELEDQPVEAESIEGETVEPREPGVDEERQFDPGPNPRPWAHNNLAGVQLWDRREPYEAAIIFAEKPPQEIIDHVKAQGFHWDGKEQAWTRPIAIKTRAQDRVIASRTYREAVELLLKAKGLEPEPARTPF